MIYNIVCKNFYSILHSKNSTYLCIYDLFHILQIHGMYVYTYVCIYARACRLSYPSSVGLHFYSSSWLHSKQNVLISAFTYKYTRINESLLAHEQTALSRIMEIKNKPKKKKKYFMTNVPNREVLKFPCDIWAVFH